MIIVLDQLSYLCIPLPKDRIGDDFKARIKAADSEKKRLMIIKIYLAERIIDKVSGLLDELNAEPAERSSP